MLHMLVASKANLYKSFCLMITIVYFASIVFNIVYIDIPEDLDDEPDEQATKRPRRHRKDLSMTEYVQLRLLDLSKKPWNEVIQSPLFRNYLLLFCLLLFMSTTFFIHSLYQQYKNKSKIVQNWK